MTKHPPLERNIKKAIILILIGSVFLALQAMFVKLASPFVNPSVLVFDRAIICLFAVYFAAAFHFPKEIFKGLYKTHHFKKHLIRSGFGMGGVFGFYIALKMISIANATVLLLTMPLFVPIIGRIWKKVKIPAKMWIGIGISFLGVIILLRPDRGIVNIGALFALAGGMSGAIGLIGVRNLHHYREPSLRIMSYFFTFTALVGLIAALATPETYEISWSRELFLLLIMVGFSTLGYQICLTLAGKYAPMRLLSPFLYFSIILTIFPDYFIWKDHLTISTIIGIILIVIGTIIKVLLFPKKDEIVEKKIL
ncbi:MAG: DMT family transporter [Simkaniaceae bacterium]|nr:DMT family transporter [Simkaniaceae bacterium]